MYRTTKYRDVRAASAPTLPRGGFGPPTIFPPTVSPLGSAAIFVTRRSRPPPTRSPLGSARDVCAAQIEIVEVASRNVQPRGDILGGLKKEKVPPFRARFKR